MPYSAIGEMLRQRLLEMTRRFLAPKGRSGDGWGYVDNPEMAMRDEPEALTREEHARHIDQDSKRAAEQQRHYEEGQREKKWRMMTFDQGLAEVQLEANRRCIDINSDLWAIRQMQRAGKKLKHLERRLGAIRRKVYR